MRGSRFKSQWGQKFANKKKKKSLETSFILYISYHELQVFDNYGQNMQKTTPPI